MPLTLSAGVSKKMGLPDYGSLGATCQVQVELDASLLQDDLEAFHRHVRNAYVACSQAVQDELARHREAMARGPNAEDDPDAPSGQPEGNGRESVFPEGDGPNGEGPDDNRQNGQPASARQIDFLRVLARQIRGLGVRRLDQFSQAAAGRPLADLSAAEASRLIDALKGVRSGRLELDVLMKKEMP
jgi:hypothetical protein